MSIGSSEHRNVTTVLGATKRKGRWTVPRKFSVNVVLGGAQIDLRDCDLPPGLTEMTIRCVGGRVVVIVRPEVLVDLGGASWIGGIRNKTVPPAPSPDQPLLRISGFTTLGSVRVSTRMREEPRASARPE